MLAMRFGLARRVLGTFLTSYCCDDEGFFGKWPTIANASHLIDSKLTVVHFAFAPQYLGSGMDIFRSLPLYNMLVSRLTNMSLEVT